MSKSKYCIASFPSNSTKNPLATFSEDVLETIDRISEILQSHSNGSHEQYPWRVFRNMKQNSESIFDQGISYIISSTGTPSEKKSSPKSTSPSKGQKLPLVDRTNEDLVSKTLETKSCEIEKITSSPVEDDKMDIDTSEDAEMKIDSKDENKEGLESKEDMKDPFRGNSAEITSVSIIKHEGVINVEVDIDSDWMFDESLLMKTEQESSPSKIVKSPGKPKIKTKSPTGSPSKSKKSPETKQMPSESFVNVYDSNPDVLGFLAERLVSIFESRKTCMEQMDSYFKNFLDDAMSFCSTIKDIKFIVENIPVAREPYLSDDFLELRASLIDKALAMTVGAESWLKGVKEDINDLESCLNKMDTFEKQNAAFLSSKGTSKQTVTDLQNLETDLKKIFTEADEATILTDKRQIILLKLLSDFKWLVNHFVKFLIIAGILKPSTSESSQSGMDK